MKDLNQDRTGKDAARPDIARLLASRDRTLPGHPDRWMLGPTGKRLWMDYLDPAPGFSGRADFIHKMNLPLLFSVRRADRAECTLSPARMNWQVNEGRLAYSDGGVSLEERKLITWDDLALSFQVWENRSGRTVTLELVLPDGAAAGALYAFPCRAHGVTPVMLVGCGAPWAGNRLTLPPGETRRFLIAAAVGLPEERDALASRVEAALRRPDPETLMDEQARAYMAWFDGAPDLECSDPRMVRCWYYRFYLMRKNLACPGVGRLPGPCFYEGRGHRMDKTPYHPSGWEFPRLIPLSVPLQVMDARWMRDGAGARNTLLALAGCMDENGMFAVTGVDGSAKVYAHAAAWSLYQYDLIHDDAALVAEVLPAYKADARRVYERACHGDSLQVEDTHALTGKEYQPSFWYFTDDCFPHTVRPAREGYTPLKRVDRSVYMYLNFRGLAALCRKAGDPDAAFFETASDRIRRDILGKMWDPVSRCFYDLHWQTDEKAYVRNIVAFYPLWAEITGDEHLAAFSYLLSGDYFSLGSGFASAAADCPVFSPDGGWRGDYFKGPHGCMWNGPSWPYTTGIALDALARQSKRHGHAYDAAFEARLAEYTAEHFADGPDAAPDLVEFYHSRTGAPLSEEADYFHSFWLDLVIRHVAGVEPGEQDIMFHPLHTDLQYFAVRRLLVRGHEIEVFYQRTAGAPYAGLPAGYTVFADGRRVYQGDGREAAVLIPCTEPERRR